MKVSIPDKLYFKIGEVSKLAEVAPHVLRYWESEFTGITPKRAKSKQRLYRREDVELILKIKDLLHGQGYTISGARKFIASGEEMAQEPAGPAAPSVPPCLEEIKSELLDLQKILQNKN